jgi:SAM-dependent methyltransferase
VLDVGCGNGTYLAFVREHVPGAKRCGIEIDASRVAEARARDPEATIAQGDALASLDQFEGGFDLITLWDVFEHVHAPGRLLEALAAKLAPGGWIYLQTIHENSFVPLSGRAIHALSGGRLTYPVRRTHEAHHLTFFTRGALDALTERAGLRMRELWWGRLARDRMDGPGWLTAATAAVLWLENALGNGLFVNLLLEPASPAAAGSSPAPDREAGRATG